MTSFADTLLAGVTRPDRGARRVLPVAVAGAVTLHLAAGALGLLPPRASAAELPPVEIELAPPEAAKPPEPPKPEEPKPEEAKPEPPAPEAPKAIVLPAEKAPPASAPAPAAARAGALLTASDDAPKSAGEEPVRFVTDPDGGSYGSGVVARGGTADVGAPGAKVGGAPNGAGAAIAKPPAPVAKPSGGGEALVAAKDWSRAPRLGDADACKGYFPSAADDDAGEVVVQVVVRASGEPGGVTVVTESPRGQGFGAAAKSCLSGKRFEPALGKDGQAVAAATSVRIKFSR